MTAEKKKPTTSRSQDGKTRDRKTGQRREHPGDTNVERDETNRDETPDVGKKLGKPH